MSSINERYEQFKKQQIAAGGGQSAYRETPNVPSAPQERTVRAGETSVSSQKDAEGNTIITESTPQVTLPNAEVTRRSYEAMKGLGPGTVTSQAVEQKRTEAIAAEIGQKGGVEVRERNQAAQAAGYQAYKENRDARAQYSYEVKIEDRISGGPFHYQRDIGKREEKNYTEARVGRPLEVKSKAELQAERLKQSNANLARGALAYPIQFGGALVSLPYEVAGRLGNKKAGAMAEKIRGGARDVSDSIDKAVGYEGKDKEVVSPAGLATSSIALGIAKATGDKEREANLSKDVDYQTRGAKERPGEFIFAAGIDLLPVGGAKKAGSVKAKSPIAKEVKPEVQARRFVDYERTKQLKEVDADFTKAEAFTKEAGNRNVVVERVRSKDELVPGGPIDPKTGQSNIFRVQEVGAKSVVSEKPTVRPVTVDQVVKRPTKAIRKESPELTEGTLTDTVKVPELGIRSGSPYTKTRGTFKPSGQAPLTGTRDAATMAGERNAATSKIKPDLSEGLTVKSKNTSMVTEQAPKTRKMDVPYDLGMSGRKAEGAGYTKSGEYGPETLGLPAKEKPKELGIDIRKRDEQAGEFVERGGFLSSFGDQVKAGKVTARPYVKVVEVVATPGQFKNETISLGAGVRPSAFKNQVINLGKGNAAIETKQTAPTGKADNNPFIGGKDKTRRREDTGESAPSTENTSSEGSATILEAPETSPIVVEESAAVPNVDAPNPNGGGLGLGKDNNKPAPKGKPFMLGKRTPQVQAKENRQDKARKQVGESLGFKQQEQQKAQTVTTQKPVEKVKQNFRGAPTVSTATTPATTAAIRSVPLITTTPRQGTRPDASQQPAAIRKIDVDPLRGQKRTPQQTPFTGQTPRTTGKITPKTTPDSPTIIRPKLDNPPTQIRTPFLRQPPRNPPRKPPTVIKFDFNRLKSRTGSSRIGPTRGKHLGVKNIAARGLDIKPVTGKGPKLDLSKALGLKPVKKKKGRRIF